MDHELALDAQQLAADVADRTFGDQADGELMRRAIDLMTRLVLRLETHAEANRLSRQIIEQLRRRSPAQVA